MPHTAQGVPWTVGSETSRDAALRAQPWVGTQGLKVYHWLQDRGERGGTMTEAELERVAKRSSLCGRFRALEQAGAIRKIAIKRAGSQAYVVCGPVPAQPRLWA